METFLATVSSTATPTPRETAARVGAADSTQLDYVRLNIEATA